jgi:hypothetical protein
LLGGAVVVVAIVMLSAINARDSGVTFGIALRFLLGLCAAWCIASSRLRYSSFAIALVLSATAQAVLIGVQFILQHVPASTFFGLASHGPDVAGDAVVETSIGRFLRPYGSLPHPNIAAGWLAFGLVALLGLHLRSKDWLERAVILAAFCIVTAGLFFTFSRSGLLAWFLVFLLSLVIVLSRERMTRHPWWHAGFAKRDLPEGLKAMKLVASSVLLFGLLLLAYAPLVRGRMDVVQRIERQSLSERISQVDEARTVIRENWLFGVGAGNYTKAVHDFVDAGREWWGYQPVHVAPLLVLAEIGVVGAIVFLWFIGMIVATLIRDAKKRWFRAHEIPYGVFAALGLAVVAIVSFADHYPWSLPFGISFGWLAFGLWLRSYQEDA